MLYLIRILYSYYNFKRRKKFRFFFQIGMQTVPFYAYYFYTLLCMSRARGSSQQYYLSHAHVVYKIYTYLIVGFKTVAATGFPSSTTGPRLWRGNRWCRPATATAHATSVFRTRACVSPRFVSILLSVIACRTLTPCFCTSLVFN